MTNYHTPVLLSEVITALALRPGMTVLDGTLGGGGHARAILERISPTGQLIGFDQDQQAIAHVQQTLGLQYGAAQLIVIHDNVRRLSHYAEQVPGLDQLDAALLDLGISAHQLIEPGRGFSFQNLADPLDMRMDQRQTVTAADILNTWSERALVDLLQVGGEEPRARSIAHTIIDNRPLQTVGQLVDCIRTTYRGHRYPKHHLATRTFQALRIAVNDELALLPQLLQDIIARLQPDGRLAVISFHSLEDRIVKQQFAAAAQGCVCPPELPVCRCNHLPTIKIMNKKPIIPTLAEIKANPKSRSAKLRVIRKINNHD